MSSRLDTQFVVLNTGARIPILGYGTFLLHGKQACHCTRRAIAMGYRLIDTAAFHRNEERIGEAIRSCGVPREDLFVTTKLWYKDHGYQNTLDAFYKSLDKLGLDYVDLYLVQWPGVDSGDPKDVAKIRAETWRAMEQLYQEGRARAIGVSNFTIKHLTELLKYAKVVPAVNQCECHPRLTQEKLRKFCREKEIVFQSYSPLAKGELLTNPTVISIARRHKRTSAQVLLRWNIQKGNIVIPKTITESRMRENTHIFSWELGADDMRNLDALNRDYHCTWNPEDVP